ncbi:hypothetical protein PENCOP_c011G06098 [Penicillium coprophilum]|uniref:Uncharacterized protein n=1 Tax=Penicillium coprophilum TaxID=36646 RepID=A0A1V6UEK1_9EURO|nr:hypothetical protein PENCOP_c011G06098 [Penicillium coprophilum]
MPPLNDGLQHEPMLMALSSLIYDLRSNPESRCLAIARLNAISRLPRICAQFGKDAHFTQLCDTLQRGLPGQIALLNSDINRNFIIADALGRIKIRYCLVSSVVAALDKDIEMFDEEADQDVHADATDEESNIESIDANYIARLLLGSTWAKPIVDFDDEPYGEVEVVTDSSGQQSEINSSNNDYTACLLICPS